MTIYYFSICSVSSVAKIRVNLRRSFGFAQEFKGVRYFFGFVCAFGESNHHSTNSRSLVYIRGEESGFPPARE
jgi:hypothetical protein